MANFNSTILTKQGLELLARVQVGETGMQFTKAVTGDGTYTEDDKLAFMTELKSPKQEFGLNKITIINEATVRVKIVITNAPEGKEPLKHGYHVSEVGLYAKDDDNNEILYAVTTSADNEWDYLPAYNDLMPSAVIMDMYTEVCNADSVTMVVHNGIYATEDEMDLANEEIRKVNVRVDDVNTRVDGVNVILNRLHASAFSGNADRVNGHTVDVDVPAGAKFTDTHLAVVDNLTSDSTTDALSPRQGKILDGKITALTQSMSNSLANHTHSQYALTTHTHDYSPSNHTHSNYALSNHTHNYASVNHTHSGYASATHTHSGYASTTELNNLKSSVSSGKTSLATAINSLTGNRGSVSASSSFDTMVSGINLLNRVDFICAFGHYQSFCSDNGFIMYMSSYMSCHFAVARCGFPVHLKKDGTIRFNVYHGRTNEQAFTDDTILSKVFFIATPVSSSGAVKNRYENAGQLLLDEQEHINWGTKDIIFNQGNTGYYYISFIFAGLTDGIITGGLLNESGRDPHGTKYMLGGEIFTKRNMDSLTYITSMEVL